MNERKGIGRPLKYVWVLDKLQSDQLYSAGMIGRLAKYLGYFDDLPSDEAKRIAQRNLRQTMVRRANLHEFPDEGDGIVTIRGQAPCPGWFGWRWKKGRE